MNDSAQFDEVDRPADSLPAPVAGSLEAEIDRETSRLKRVLKILGPGLVTGASDDDPSGIGTYAMVGAQLGYAPLWTALVTYPLMASVQFICAKIGLVKRRDFGVVKPALSPQLGLRRRHRPDGRQYY